MIALNLGIGAPVACVMHCVLEDSAAHHHTGGIEQTQDSHQAVHNHHHPELIAVQFWPSDAPVFQEISSTTSTEVPWFCHHAGGEPVAIFPAVIEQPKIDSTALIIVGVVERATPTWNSWPPLTPLRPPISSIIS